MFTLGLFHGQQQMPTLTNFVGRLSGPWNCGELARLGTSGCSGCSKVLSGGLVVGTVCQGGVAPWTGRVLVSLRARRWGAPVPLALLWSLAYPLGICPSTSSSLGSRGPWLLAGFGQWEAPTGGGRRGRLGCLSLAPTLPRTVVSAMAVPASPPPIIALAVTPFTGPDNSISSPYPCRLGC